jgi:hypothetical protein
MNRLTAIGPVLFLTALASAQAADSHLAKITSNCGRTDGGAYEISIDLGGKDISIHAEGSGLGEWSAPSNLEILICDRRQDSCAKPKRGFLRLKNERNDNYAGTVVV